MSKPATVGHGSSRAPHAQPRIHDFAGLRVSGVHHGISERGGGVSPAPFNSLNLRVKTGDVETNVNENRKRFLSRLSPGSVAAYGQLTHGRDVAVFLADSSFPSDRQPPSPDERGTTRDPSTLTFPADAAVSNVPGLTLVMMFADCAPIFLWDEEHSVCGLVHGGWRGTALLAASTAVATMRTAFGTRPSAVRAGIGPRIGPCCYTVGTEVTEAFAAAYGRNAGLISNGRLDLGRANQVDLLSAGLDAANIDALDTCTSCRKDLFFSHRAEKGKTGRFGAGIGLDASGAKRGWRMTVHEYGTNFTSTPELRAR